MKRAIGTRCDLAIEKGKGHHCNKNWSRVFSNILEQAHHKSKTFKHTVGWEYKAFPKLQKNIFMPLTKSPHIDGLTDINANGTGKTGISIDKYNLLISNLFLDWQSCLLVLTQGKHFLLIALMFERLDIKLCSQILIQGWVVQGMIKITQG